MKGIVFTEFLKMVEDKFGYETVDKIITESKVPNDGAYSAVGTYDHTELVSMVIALHQSSGIPIPDLIKVYGNYFFGVLRDNYGVFLDRVDNLFDFFGSIHDHIHVEVKKLYPDAELPAFAIESASENQMVMVYTSQRKLGDFALGLMEEAAKHYNEDVTIEKSMLAEDGSEVRFVITKK